LGNANVEDVFLSIAKALYKKIAEKSAETDYKKHHDGDKKKGEG
jgi:hypothetical protein